MKTLLTALITLTALNTYAASPIVGKYSAKKEVVFPSAQDPVTCKEEEGKWNGPAHSGYCSMEASDVVTVTPLLTKEFKLSIFTFGNNLHHCSFEENAKLVGNVLTAKPKGVNCRVQATFVNDSVTITSSGDGCSDYCGAFVELDTEELKKEVAGRSIN